ncbi:MAG: hypothetical protein ACJ8G2_16330 [Burkholderiales bacterium]
MESRVRASRLVPACSRLFIALIACIGTGACTTMLPMTDDLKSSMSEQEVKRIASITHLPEEIVRDPKIHEVHEVKLSCWQMMQQCYPSVPFYLKMLGSVPLGCTTIYQQPWAEKVAIVYSCWMTDPATMEHERRHAKGEMHAGW